MSATSQNYIGSDWVTSDITLTTDADQTPIAPGARVSDVTRNGRRTAHFVSTAPILNFFSIQSADYRVALDRPQRRSSYRSIYHAGHDWNVAKMLRAIGAALDYYRAHFGPYQFHYARIIEFPGYQQLRPGLRRHHALFGNDRLQRQDRRSRRRSTSRPMSSPTRCRTNIGRTR